MKKVVKLLVAISVMMSLVAMPLEGVAATKKSRHYTRAKTSYAKKTSVRKKSSYGRYLATKVGKSHFLRAAVPAISQPEYDGSQPLTLDSSKVLVLNQTTGEVVYAKNTNSLAPIASITKLMTAMVMLDAQLPLDEQLIISEEDLDYLKGTGSRLGLGTVLTRGELLQLALMSSENRAASALGRNYPGGKEAFVKAMNAKALSLGLVNTEFVDPTGLDSSNISTAEDLAKMVNAAYQYPEIRAATTSASHEVFLNSRGYATTFKNTNGLVRESDWEIGLSKTGFISEAGRCLVMQAKISGEQLIIVLLDAAGKWNRISDANRIRKWVEYNTTPRVTTTGQTTLKLSDKLS